MKILIFSPFSAVWAHAFPEALLGMSLAQSNHEIFRIGCNESYRDLCISMRANGLTVESSSLDKQRICNICKENNILINEKFNFKNKYLSDFIGSNALEKIDKILYEVNPDNYFDYSFMNLPIGRLSLYETMLQYKKNSFSFEENSVEWATYKVWLKNALITAFAANAIFDEIQPDAVIIYNNFYSTNNVIHRIAIGRSIKSYSTHAWDNYGSLYSGLLLVQGNNYDYAFGFLKNWERFKNCNFSFWMIKKTIPHIISLIAATNNFIYSSGKSHKEINIRERFNIRKSKKIAVALMSSYDEIFSTYAIGALETIDNVIFEDQIEWVKNIIEFVKNREDLFLIIRIHPREFPNRRDNQKSSNAHIYGKMFSSLPDNVCINWPSDNISIYDLAEYADVVLNGFSSAGLEMATLGIPVVSYANEWNSYPIDLDYKSQTKEEYFVAIQKALCDGWSYKRAECAVKWRAFKLNLNSIDISDAFNMQVGDGIHKFEDLNNIPPMLIEKNHINKFIESNSVQYADIFSDDYLDDISKRSADDGFSAVWDAIIFALYGNNYDGKRFYELFKDRVYKKAGNDKW